MGKKIKDLLILLLVVAATSLAIYFVWQQGLFSGDIKPPFEAPGR